MTNRKILLIILDQLRADALSGGLYDGLAIPHLRQLMEESVTFTRHFTVTSPCGPSRASMFSGLYAMNHRSIRNGTPLHRRHTNLAWQMRRAGYMPLLLGYSDTSLDPYGRAPQDPDLQTYENFLPGFCSILPIPFGMGDSWLAELKAKNYLVDYNSGPFSHLFYPVDTTGRPSQNRRDPAYYQAQDSDTAFLTDQAIKTLSVRQQQDWFLALTYFKPHPPFVAPAPFHTMYDCDAISPGNLAQTREEKIAAHPFFKAYFHGSHTEQELFYQFDGRIDQIGPRDAQELRALYCGLVSEIDQNLGRLFAWLRETGQYDDTLLIVTSDHGEMLGDHFLWGKMTPYEQSFHIPLIIRDPRNLKMAGRKISKLSESVDLAPTILEWVGLSPPAVFDGASLLPFLSGQQPKNWRDKIFIELDLADPQTPTCYQKYLKLRLRDANVAILREERYKLVHFNGGLPPLLFDLQNDPQENHNLAQDPACQQLLQRLQSRMLDHRMSYADRELSQLKITGQGVFTSQDEY